MSLVQHFTIVVGGGFLIPMLFYTMGRYYRVSDDALKQLRHDGILAGNFAFGRSSLLCRFPVLVRSIIGLFVGFLVFLQVSQANRDVNYSHILNGNFTKCGIYYLCLFPILAYGILLFVIDTACFGRSVSNLCTKHLLKPALFHPDGRYGFRRLIGSTFYIHLTIVLIGVYFVVMFVSWRNYRSMPQLFDRTEHVLIFVSYLSLCPIVLWWLLHPLRRLLVDFKSGLLRRLYEGLRLERLVGNDPHTTGLMEELDGKGFYPLYERIAALTTNVVTLDLLANVYTSIIVPGVVPIGPLWLQKKFV